MTLYHLPSQLFIALIVCIALYHTYLGAKRNKLSKPFLTIWLSFWLLILLTIFNLDKLSLLAQTLGIGRGVDLVIYLSLIFLFYQIYHLIINQKTLTKQITQLTREIALQNTHGKK